MLSKEDYNILRILRSKNIGNITFFKLLKFFENIDNIINNFNEFNRKFNTNLSLIDEKEIDKELNNCKKIGAKIITYKNKSYSELLKNIYNFPIVLTILGNEEFLNKNSVSIVGSRNCSSNSAIWTKKISNELGNNNFIIVSGMASGIDSFAHLGAIDTGTIAVLGTGINQIYPNNNKDLYEKIKEKGLLISEFPYDTLPKTENFPIRNRIISGLSKTLIVVEASAKSGTLITVKNALEQNREIFVVPGNPYDYRFVGSNQLIKDGANIITDVNDILEFYNYNKIIKKEEERKNTQFNKKPNNANLRELILSKLNYSFISIDSFFETFDNIDISEFNSKLIELELEGLITIQNGLVKIK